MNAQWLQLHMKPWARAWTYALAAESFAMYGRPSPRPSHRRIPARRVLAQRASCRNGERCRGTPSVFSRKSLASSSLSLIGTGRRWGCPHLTPQGRSQDPRSLSARVSTKPWSERSAVTARCSTPNSLAKACTCLFQQRRPPGHQHCIETCRRELPGELEAGSRRSTRDQSPRPKSFSVNVVLVRLSRSFRRIFANYPSRE